MTGAAVLTFLLGLFYRSATMYHPQRRAILHLKSQKRKITIRNGHGGNGETKPFRNLTGCLKRRSVQMIFLAATVASAGLYVPLLYLVGGTKQKQRKNWKKTAASF